MPLPWAWQPTAKSHSIVNLTERIIFTRIIRRTIRFPSCIYQSAVTEAWRLRQQEERKPLESMRFIWRRMREN